MTRRTFLQLGGAALSMALPGRQVSVSSPSGSGRRTRRGPDVSLRDDGTVLVHGEPFFPFGYYFIGPANRTADERLAQHLRALRALAGVGFNLMYARANPADLRRYGILLDEAWRRGIWMLNTIGSVRYDPAAHEMLPLVTAFQDKPAVLGWAIADDAGLHNSPAAIRHVDAAVKAVDPHHLTYLSAVGESDIARFAAAADLLGCQAFYVHDDRKNWADPLQYIAPEYVRASAAAAAYRHPIIANLQTFSWKGERGPGTDPHARWPSGAEVRTMTYQALLGGARGIIYYTYQDVHTDVRVHPDVWTATVALVPELLRLRAVILNGVRLALTTDGGHVQMGGWTYRGYAYVVVVNTSHTRAVRTALALPEGMAGPAVPLFPSRAVGLVYRTGWLTGLIGPSDVQIYVLPVQGAGGELV